MFSAHVFSQCTSEHGRLVTSVSAAAASAAAPPDSGASAVRALISTIQQEEVAVHIDVKSALKVRTLLISSLLAVTQFSVVQEMTLEHLPPGTLPLSEPTDKLAQLRAKALKRGYADTLLSVCKLGATFICCRIAQPFPFMELELFLPTWAALVFSHRIAIWPTCTLHLHECRPWPSSAKKATKGTKIPRRSANWI